MGQTHMPIRFPGHWQRTQQIVECPVKSLTLTISFWVVRGGARFYNAIQVAQLVDEGAFKVTALIRVQPCWDPKLIKPFRHKDPGHCDRMLIQSWNSYSVFSKNICQDQNILHTILSRLQSGVINGQDFIGI